MSTNLWIIIFFTTVISLLAPMAWRPLLVRANVVDVPNHRSSHSKPTLRGGGIAPLTSILIGALLTWLMLDGDDRTITAIGLVTALIVGFVGLAEDVRGLAITARVAIQLTIGLFVAIFLSWQTEISLVWIPLTALFFAANVNFTNFMDGINGISSFHGIVVGLGFSLLGNHEGYLWLTVMGLLTAAAFAGFLPWNLIPPGMFLGDSGSYLLGGLTSVMAISALYVGMNPVPALALLSIYWFDTVSTLVKRALRKESIFEAHRSHTYQRLAVQYQSHLQAASVVTAFTAFVFIAAIFLANDSLKTTVVSIILLSAIWTLYYILPKLIERRKVSSE